MNAILEMNIAISNYRTKLTMNNEDDIEYKTTIYHMKYLEKPEIYKKLSKTKLDFEKQFITAKFREIIDRKSRNIINKKIEDDLYS
jgi:hypothetical protein